MKRSNVLFSALAVVLMVVGQGWGYGFAIVNDQLIITPDEIAVYGSTSQPPISYTIGEKITEVVSAMLATLSNTNGNTCILRPNASGMARYINKYGSGVKVLQIRAQSNHCYLDIILDASDNIIIAVYPNNASNMFTNTFTLSSTANASTMLNFDYAFSIVVKWCLTGNRAQLGDMVIGSTNGNNVIYYNVNITNNAEMP